MSEKSRMRWLCRRGMKELDVLLERFMNAMYDDLTVAERDAFEALLHNEDPDLYDLLFGRVVASDDMQARIISRIDSCASVR